MATLGKALGTSGAFVAGDARFIDALAQFARSHVYSTAPPPALAAESPAEPMKRPTMAMSARL